MWVDLVLSIENPLEQNRGFHEGKKESASEW